MSTHSPAAHTPPHWWLIGDAAALVTISALSAATMAVAHHITGRVWVVGVVLGMVAAMVVQMALASVAGLLLGSIETQVPSTLGGMLAAMAVCALGFAFHLRLVETFAIGAALGLLVVLWLDRYRRACERDLVINQECS